MSTEKQEISLEQSNMTLEEEAKKQTETQAMVANDETRVEVSEADNTSKSTDDVRPDWLPEKFKSAEDMAKAYSELEKKQSTPEEQPAEDKTYENETNQKGMDKFYSEYQEQGSLSEKSYEELNKMGLDKSLVDGYIAGQEAIANTEVQQVHNLVGGADNYNKVIEYAKTNLNEAEQNAFNETLETGSIEQVKFAVQGIASRAGVNSEQPQSMINGDSIETNSDVFESSAQVIDAMNDPRYAKDPAFRKLVEEKIARSTAV
tara:strand:+ start:162 stop:944 length:783 start_codon:yes stop_codon:yes gene_type:complete